MMVGALDLETGSTDNYTAQRPGPWDRDSNSGWRYIFCAMCVIVKYYVAYTLQNILQGILLYREMKEKQRGILEMRVIYKTEARFCSIATECNYAMLIY